MFSSAGNKLKLPPKPTMFQGSTSAPHSMPRFSKSSISGMCRATGLQLMGVDRLVAGGEQAIDLAQHAGRGDAHGVGLLERGVGIAHAGVELRQVHVLHLGGAAAGQLVVQMLPGAAERLPRALRLGPQPVAVLARGARQQLLVELIAIGGDVRQQGRQRHVGVVAGRAVAGGAGGHQDRAGEHGGRFEHAARRAWTAVAASRPPLPLGGEFDAREQRVERHLLQHEAAVVAAVVDVVQVPLAEVVIGPLAGRVIEIVGPRIERQLLDQLRIEPGLVQNLRIGVGENRQRPFDQLLVDARARRRRRGCTAGSAAPARGRTAPSAVRIRARRPADSRGNR